MSSARLRAPARPRPPATGPLPQLLRTPSGLALLELQGSLNFPSDQDGETPQIRIGSLEFPDYAPGAPDSAWMDRVTLYVGPHQRLTGVVKKLPRALAVVRRCRDSHPQPVTSAGDLEMVEIVEYKLVFSNRPEPVGTADAQEAIGIDGPSTSSEAS